jgi:acetyl-CoA synthetase
MAERAKVLVTTECLYQKVVAPLRGRLPLLERVILIGDHHRRTMEPGTENYQRLMETSTGNDGHNRQAPEDLTLLTMTAEGLRAESILAPAATRSAVPLTPEDVVWCTGAIDTPDAAWCGLVAPLTQGATCVLEESPPDLAHWRDFLLNQHITVWYHTGHTPASIATPLAAAAPPPGLRYLSGLGRAPTAEEADWIRDRSRTVGVMPFSSGGKS